jgi:hypothetical protein
MSSWTYVTTQRNIPEYSNTKNCYFVWPSAGITDATKLKT